MLLSNVVSLIVTEYMLGHHHPVERDVPLDIQGVEGFAKNKIPDTSKTKLPLGHTKYLKKNEKLREKKLDPKN